MRAGTGPISDPFWRAFHSNAALTRLSRVWKMGAAWGKCGSRIQEAARAQAFLPFRNPHTAMGSRPVRDDPSFEPLNATDDIGGHIVGRSPDPGISDLFQDGRSLAGRGRDGLRHRQLIGLSSKWRVAAPFFPARGFGRGVSIAAVILVLRRLGRGRVSGLTRLIFIFHDSTFILVTVPPRKSSRPRSR